jgi:hypothetical protein
MMAWVDALRKYAEMKGKKFRIYKKGSAEYDEIKKLQHKGKGALTKKQVSSMASKMAAESEGKKPRKPRSDIGKKRMTTKQIVDESVRQKLVSKAVAYGRKVRSDKGKKRGPRKAKEEGSKVPPKSREAGVLVFDEEGNVV